MDGLVVGLPSCSSRDTWMAWWLVLPPFSSIYIHGWFGCWFYPTSPLYILGVFGGWFYPPSLPYIDGLVFGFNILLLYRYMDGLVWWLVLPSFSSIMMQSNNWVYWLSSEVGIRHLLHKTKKKKITLKRKECVDFLSFLCLVSLPFNFSINPDLFLHFLSLSLSENILKI